MIFTFMETSPDGGIHFRGESPMVGWWLRSRGEPFLWGCRRDLLGDFLDACGLRPRSLAGHDELKREILCPLGADSLSLARGECLCLATPVPS